jgi:hypothetical protein
MPQIRIIIPPSQTQHQKMKTLTQIQLKLKSFNNNRIFIK